MIVSQHVCTHFLIKVESRLYVQVGTQKFGRRTERDVQMKIIFRITHEAKSVFIN